MQQSYSMKERLDIVYIQGDIAMDKIKAVSSDTSAMNQCQKNPHPDYFVITLNPYLLRTQSEPLLFVAKCTQ